ncbi:conserved hypothetical protein [Ricinus communis]|uniref:Uncharacterized protein n=1 Tax=Ricinus communis TaxID=3988 RepID=B9S8C6_RICCO|nr:conserved hypothetical protein [Ricinus communis]
MKGPSSSKKSKALQVDPNDEYKVGDVPNLRIDITEPFLIEDFAPVMMINAADFHRKVDLQGPEIKGNQMKGVLPYDLKDHPSTRIGGHM